VAPYADLVSAKVVQRITPGSKIWLHRVLTRQASTVFDYDDGIHLGRQKFFEKTVKQTKVVLAGCDTLAEAALAAGAKDVRIWRTGVGTSAYHVNTHTDQACPLVWTGSSSTVPYLTGFADVLSKTKQTVRVICDRRPIWQVPTQFVPWSPITQTQALLGCSIGLAPLPDNAWTRCKCAFKIVQYMAAGLPVVASAVGANQELFKYYDCKGICARTDKEFLDGILWLQNDPAERQRMGLANRKIAEQHFDYKVLATTLTDVLCQS
jgi:glycosyltransferase involved in cell wall biosynthesis